jgi:hypothetical protein
MKNKWVVKFHFVKNDKQPVQFLVQDYDSCISVMRAIQFEDEVFKVELWQRKEF